MNLRMTFFVLCLLPVNGHLLAAQDATDPTHVYEAYYRVSRADLDEWNRLYQEESVPVLTDLQNEGIIQGWDQWQHSTGGEYNIRLSIRTYDWASFERFWDEFLSRRSESATRRGRMILAHRDEIWNVNAVNAPADTEIGYLYASTYQVNFPDLEEWNRLWTDVAIPILDEAMDDGLLGGWVLLGHNTGGPHNSKMMYLFENWDGIDDVFESLQETLAEEHAEDWETMNRLRGPHDDIIWVPTPTEAD